MQGMLFIVRPEADAFTMTIVARVPEDKFASWATFQFRMLLESARKLAEWFLNRPGISQLRTLDENFYVVLSIQSFKRGVPLVPASDGHGEIIIDAGERLGMKGWNRFQPGEKSGGNKFRLSQYLMAFLKAIGEDFEAYDVLDSRELVHYQCVCRRSSWEAVKSRFFQVFPLAKTAYRRANGGSSAPGVNEDVEAKFIDMDPNLKAPPAIAAEPRLIVRNTFLDIEDDEELERKAECQARSDRRPKTLMVYPSSTFAE